MNKPFFELVQQDDKYVLDVSDTLNDMFLAFHQRLETLCEADFDHFARKLGYTKLGPGQCVVDAIHLRWLVDATCKDTCQAFESIDECSDCWVESIRQSATAALDGQPKE